MIDYSIFRFAKARPAQLEKQDKQRDLDRRDEAENAEARRRSGGRCEVRVGTLNDFTRCLKPAHETHHLKGGIGRRNVGTSILATFKLRCCSDCHKAITGHVLQPTTDKHTAETVRYRRVR